MVEAISLPFHVRTLGLQPYEEVWQQMRRFTDERSAESADEVWHLSHSPVFTLGQAGKPEHLLMPGSIPVVQTDRGGQVTYHGPGQLVLYLLFDLRRLKWGVRHMVDQIESSLIELLAAYGISAHAKKEAPGVYVGEAKIASLGLRIRKGCSYHGLSLNVAMDLEPYQRINVCGYPGLAVTQMADLLPHCPAEQEICDQLMVILAARMRVATEEVQKNDRSAE